MIKVLGERVLDKIFEEQTISKGGIITGTKMPSKTNKGVIIGVGKLVDIENMKVGDKVVFDKYGGIPIALPEINNDSLDNDFIILKQDDVIAIEE